MLTEPDFQIKKYLPTLNNWSILVASSASTIDLRRQNRHLVLRAIAEHGAVSRTVIAETVRLTNAAVSRIVRELVEARLLTEYPATGKRRQAGRPQIRLGLADDGAFVLGMSITLNQKEVVLATCRGEVVARRDCAGLPLDRPEPALAALAQAAVELMAASGRDRQRILGGAALIAGRVDPATGRLRAGGPLGWGAVDAADTLTRLTGVPFVAEGRAAALLQAEARQGCAAGLRDVLLVNVGLRIGSALMLDGAPVRGAANEAGQLAEFPSCGATLDDLASGLAILRRLDGLGLTESTGPADDGRRLRDVAEPGRGLPAEARSVLAEAGVELGRVLRLLATVLKPQAVLLAGQVGRHPGYVAGVGRAAADPALPGRAFDTQVSALTTAQSTVWLALDRHLFHERFDLGRLAPDRAASGATAAA